MKKHVVPPASASEIIKALGVSREDMIEARKLILRVKLDKLLKRYKISERGKKEFHKFFEELFEAIK